jgi:hypothetical protein
MMKSAVIKMLELIWDNEGKAQGDGCSWTRLNGALQSGLSIAVECGFKFNLGDFATLCEERPKGFRFGYWSGQDGERWYSMACAVERGHGGNLSAARSFEQWRNRKPFILKTFDNPSGIRLAIGHRFDWTKDGVIKEGSQRCLVAVTSFDDADGTLRACHYKGVVGEGKPVKMFTITHEQIAEYNAFIRAAKKTTEEPR